MPKEQYRRLNDECSLFYTHPFHVAIQKTAFTKRHIYISPTRLFHGESHPASWSKTLTTTTVRPSISVWSVNECTHQRRHKARASSHHREVRDCLPSQKRTTAPPKRICSITEKNDSPTRLRRHKEPLLSARLDRFPFLTEKLALSYRTRTEEPLCPCEEGWTVLIPNWEPFIVTSKKTLFKKKVTPFHS